MTIAALPTAPRLQGTCAGGGGAARNKGGARTRKCGGLLTLNPGHPLETHTSLSEHARASWAHGQLRGRSGHTDPPADLGRRQARFPDRSAGGHY